MLSLKATLVKRNSTPEQRVGRAANITIFLGILFTLIHLLAFSGLPAMAQRGYGFPGLAIAVGFVGLGYGIRYGSYAAFYLTTGGFAALSAYFAARLVITGEPAMLLRGILTAWAFASLCRAIPDMRALRQNDAFPLPMSRYGAFFLRRWFRKDRNLERQEGQ